MPVVGSGSYSDAMQLVMLLARPRLREADERRVRELMDGGVDWDAVVAFATRHRLDPLLAFHLRRFSAVPAATREELSQAQFYNAVRALERTAQLFQLLDVFRGADVIVVPYKGPALGAQLYGSAALRIFGDLDVVVRPGDVREARRLLTSIGYRPRVTLSEAKVAFMIRHRYHENFVRDDGGHVELHWGFANRDIAFDLDLERAWTRLGSVELNEREVPTFDPEDLLLILAIHGAKHRWDRLEWLAGLAELVRRSDDLQWDRLLGRASSLGVRRTVALGLCLAVDLFDAPVPSPVATRLRADPRLPLLVRHVEELLVRTPAGWELPDRIQRDRFRILLQERPKDRLRYLWNRAATPSDPDRWHVARLGPLIFPLHTFRRPLHLFGELVRGFRAPSSRETR